MLFKPFLKLHRITDITPDMLKHYGVDGLILDVDNTLSTHHGNNLLDGLQDWICLMRQNDISLIILSNSNSDRVGPFAEKIGIPYIASAAKPLPKKIGVAINKLELKKENTAIVGDQLFTDALGGNLFGIKTFITDPILRETMFGFKFKRFLEDILYSFYRFDKTEKKG